MTCVDRILAGCVVGAALTFTLAAPGALAQQADQTGKRQDEYKEAKLSPELATEARRVLVDWLECEECTEGQLERVLEFGELLTGSLAASLRDGPSPASRELLQRQLDSRYDELLAYGKEHPEDVVLSDRGTFVKIYMDNLDAIYRVRAAQALAEIGSSDARRALERAAGQDLRSDVRRVVEESLKKVQ